MLCALISDIHGNREALDAALESIRTEGVDYIACLGDIVGYGADPNYCVEVIKDAADIIIVGNHDHAAIGRTSIEYFNHYARSAAIWTAKTLSRENLDYLGGLEFTASMDDVLLAHAAPHRPEEWGYIMSSWEAKWQFSAFGEKICFIGHSHVPAEFRESGSGRRIINVGSVGQPRDNDPRGCYYIYDTEADRGRWVRFRYDYETAGEKIRRAGLPEKLAERLRWGR